MQLYCVVDDPARLENLPGVYQPDRNTGLIARGERFGSWWCFCVCGDERTFAEIRNRGGLVGPGTETPATRLSSTWNQFFAARAAEMAAADAKKHPLAAQKAAALLTPSQDDKFLNLLRAWRDGYGQTMDITS